MQAVARRSSGPTQPPPVIYMEGFLLAAVGLLLLRQRRWFARELVKNGTRDDASEAQRIFSSKPDRLRRRDMRTPDERYRDALRLTSSVGSIFFVGGLLLGLGLLPTD